MAGQALREREDFPFEVTDSPADADMKAIDDGFAEYNGAFRNPRQDICLFVRDEAGQLKAGLCAVVLDDVFNVRKLWVRKDSRKSGIGAQLMQAAEKEAAARGCTRMILDTMSFQAPEFYRKQGFAVKTVVENFYGGHDRIFLEKAIC